MSTKNTIKKIPLFGTIAKVFYDWQREKKLISKIRNFLKRKKLPFAEKAPLSYFVGHEPTIRCNLRCKMCYQGQTRSLRRSELNTDEVMAIYEKLKGKTKEIKLVGGEPFLRSDILDLISFWDKEKKRVALQTNCTLLDEAAVEELKKFKSIVAFLTSIDGPLNVHDAVRGVPGSFERASKAIGLIQKNMPHVPVSVFATLLLEDGNIKELYKLVDICRDLGVGSLNIIFEQVYSDKDVLESKNILKNFFGWGDGDYRLNTQIRNPAFSSKINFKNVKKELLNLRLRGFKKRCFVNFVPFNFYYNLEKYFSEGPTFGRVFCLKLLNPELRINQKGEVIWCDIIEKPFGSLLEKTPDEIWLSNEYQEFRKFLFKHSLPICRRCCKAVYIKLNTKN